MVEKNEDIKDRPFINEESRSPNTLSESKTGIPDQNQKFMLIKDSSQTSHDKSNFTLPKSSQISIPSRHQRNVTQNTTESLAKEGG